MAHAGRPADGALSNRQDKLLVVLHGVFAARRRCRGLPATRSPAIEGYRSARAVTSTSSAPEEVHALVRAAAAEQDAAVFLTAAFLDDHLRVELLDAFQEKPIRSSTPGAKFSTSTSQLFTSSSSTVLPVGFLVSSVIDRLL